MRFTGQCIRRNGSGPDPALSHEPYRRDLSVLDPLDRDRREASPARHGDRLVVDDDVALDDAAAAQSRSSRARARGNPGARVGVVGPTRATRRSLPVIGLSPRQPSRWNRVGTSRPLEEGCSLTLGREARLFSPARPTASPGGRQGQIESRPPSEQCNETGEIDPPALSPPMPEAAGISAEA